MVAAAMSDGLPLPEAMRRISALLRAGELAAAHTQLQSLVAANPDYLAGIQLLAGTKQAMGDVGQAEQLLRRALEIDPASTPTLVSLGELLLLAGRSAEAVALLQRALEGASPHPRAALLLARRHLDAGRPAAALAVAAPWCNSGRADV